MNSPQSERLLAYLKDTPLLAGYSISIYTPGQAGKPDGSTLQLCGTQGIPHLCREICANSLEVAAENALRSRSTIFFRCPLGIFSFAIPIAADYCLVCGGMRENLFDLYFHGFDQLESLKGKYKAHPYEILEQLEKLPVTTEKEARETMLKVERMVAFFTFEEKGQPIDYADGVQNAIAKVAAAIGKAESFKSSQALFSETLGILFDIPTITLAVIDEESGFCLMEGCWGVFPEPLYLPLNALPFRDNEYSPVKLTRDKLLEFLPRSNMSSAICLPLVNDNKLLGMAVLFDVSLADHEIRLVEQLSAELAGKLGQSMAERKTQRSRRDVRLLEIFRTLALTESQEELLRLIIEMAAELVDAARGSLMLFDKEGKILRIASSLGINPVLAPSLYTRRGEGIAGRVAASGLPLLIRDIERELNPTRQNRPRFATRSCISLPLSFKGGTIGVLNLADKKNNAPFTHADQDILTTFLDQAALILERSTVLAKAKQSVITDDLTGLYNYRFIKKRLNEELSRSIRHNLPLTLVIARVENVAGDHDEQSSANPDLFLKEAARVFSSSLRDIDLIGRIGKNEFCIILPSTSAKDSVYVAERISGAIEKKLAGGNGTSGEQTVTSIGIASFPDNGASTGELLSSARAALCRAGTESADRIRFAAGDRLMKTDTIRCGSLIKS